MVDFRDEITSSLEKKMKLVMMKGILNMVGAKKRFF